MEPKSSLLGARKVTFSRKVAESGTLQKHQFFLWLKHIIEVPGPPAGQSKSNLERCCCAGRLFFRLFCLPRRPGRAPGPKSEPQGAPKPPQGRPKSIQNPSKIVSGRPGGPQGARGYPPDRKGHQNREKTTKNESQTHPHNWKIRERSVLFFN